MKVAFIVMMALIVILDTVPLFFYLRLKKEQENSEKPSDILDFSVTLLKCLLIFCCIMTLIGAAIFVTALINS